LKVVAVIQARMGSKRLPNKMMFSLHGYPIIEWVVERVKKSKLLDDIILATSTNMENDVLAKYVKEKLDVDVFRGSEDDVLSRFYESAKVKDASHIVRICADNPLIYGFEIDKLINFYKYSGKNYDYVYNHIPKGNNYPDGLGAEIVSFKTLEKLQNKVNSKEEREHAFLHITNNPDQFSIATFDIEPEFGRPDLRFDVDTFEDYHYLAMRNFPLDVSPKELIEIFG
jgi:spore coat polysaccharide biosynthesis protein SpsF